MIEDPRHSESLALLGDLAPELGLSAAALYWAGVRGELELVRLGKSWACERVKAEAFALSRKLTV